MLVGFVPPKYEQIVTYDEHEILTDSGTWAVPEGVTEIRVVLIGGGGAGFDGTDGEPGTFNGFGASDSDYKTVKPALGQTGSVTANASCNVRSSSGGAGGEGGAAGTPGKIYQITVDVVPGQNIQYQCGSAGLTNGAVGTDSTFGEYSSASGESSQIGYTDITTGAVYAKGGSPGNAGGSGGSTGQAGQTTGNAPAGDGYGSDSGSDSDSDYEFGIQSARIDCSGTVNYNYAGAGGGGAGGDSGDVLGNSGRNASGATLSHSIGFTGPGSGWGTAESRATLYPPKGGNGGNGATGLVGGSYGSAGSGGGGGGGGGAAGTASLSASMTTTVAQHNKEGYSLQSGSASAVVEIESGRYGSGGTGGTGGSGAPGCVILYYGVQETVPSGPFVDKNDKILLDKFGRLIVV